jgi:hypothetical protein
MEPGIFAILIDQPSELNEIEVDSSGLLFVGLAEVNLRRRIRFTLQQSAASTLRRSLGSVLKQRLGLRAVSSEPDGLPMRPQRFQFADETLFDEWISAHLTYSFVRVDQRSRKLEKFVIKRLQPPLNLRGWQNPQKNKVMKLRKICWEEAEQARRRSF